MPTYQALFPFAVLAVISVTPAFADGKTISETSGTARMQIASRLPTQSTASISPTSEAANAEQSTSTADNANDFPQSNQDQMASQMPESNPQSAPYAGYGFNSQPNATNSPVPAQYSANSASSASRSSDFGSIFMSRSDLERARQSMISGEFFKWTGNQSSTNRNR